MLRNTRVQVAAVLAASVLLGYLAATGKVSSLLEADEGKNASQGKAPETAAAPGSPGATSTIDGRHLPNAPPEFRGIINPNADQSKPWWPPLHVPPKGAPNVLLIMTDDVGFGAPSTFGGTIPT